MPEPGPPRPRPPLRDDPLALHTHLAVAARGLGLRSRVTLNDRGGQAAGIHVRVRDPDGRRLAGPVRIGGLPAHGRLSLDLHDLARRLKVGGDGDLQFLFSLVPPQFEGAVAAAADGAAGTAGTVEVDPTWLSAWVYAQDHYVEHATPAGFAAGVTYQTAPFNRAAQKAPSSFFMQAPKAFLGGGRRTVFQVVHYSPDDAYARTARSWWRVRRGDGTVAAEWQETHGPNALRWIDVRERLERLGVAPEAVVDAHGFAFVEAASAEGGLLPITWNWTADGRAFTLEHSLPPPYYGSSLSGAQKAAMVAAAARPQWQASPA